MEDAAMGHLPDIVKFAYKNLKVIEAGTSAAAAKWSAVCKHCNVVVTERHGTTSGFNRHLKNKHITVYAQYKDKNPTSTTTDGKQQLPLSLFCVPGMSVQPKYRSKHPDQVRKANSFIENCIIGCGLPLSITENKYFLKFLYDMDAKFSPPTRFQISSTLVPQMCNNVMDKVASFVKSANYVSLTLDIWTDRRQHSYLGITAHAFQDCTSKSALIVFSAFKGKHTGSAIAAEVDKAITTFSLIDKVPYCLSDNASNMIKAFSVLNDLIADEQIRQDHDVYDDEDDDVPLASYVNVVDDDSLWNDLDPDQAAEVGSSINKLCPTRLSCFAHSLQLVIKDGMAKLTSARALLAKCSKLSNIVHQSAQFKEAFEAKFGALRSIPEANTTRWSSLFHQLSAIAKLNCKSLKEVLNDTGHSNLILSQTNDDNLNELVAVLGPLAEVTDVIQGDTYPTLGCVLPSVVSLHKIFTSLSRTAQFHKVFVKARLEALVTRFRGLLENVKLVDCTSTSTSSKPYIDFVYVMAAVLDPKYTFIWLDVDHLESPEVKQALKKSIIASIVDEARKMHLKVPIHQVQQSDTSQVPPEPKRSRYDTVSVFASYEGSPSTPLNATVTTIETLVTSYISYISDRRCTWAVVPEFELYTNILPLLERTFCAPATSAPVERIFSQGGLFIRPHRARLGDKILCQLIMSKCNKHL